MTKTRLLAMGLALFFSSGEAGAAPDPKPGEAPKSIEQRLAELKKPPLIFYVAKGPADSCGEGCDTWIAAEGQFDAGAPERLRRILKRLGNRKLPIYFHSAGGLVRPSLDMGRILRRQKMTAGVGATIVKACVTERLDEAACRKLKEAGTDLPADLFESGALCASACVYTFIGATTRLVAPGAKLGVHSPLAVTRYSDGHMSLSSESSVNRSIAEWRRYVTTMGIDGALMDAVTSVSFEQSRILTRDEIAKFKIDTRDFSETRWNVARQRGTRMIAYKMIVQADNTNSKYLSRTFGIGCASYANSLAIIYQIDTGPAPAEKIDVVKVEAGGAAILLKARMAMVAGGKETREGFIAVVAGRTAADSKTIDIAEQVASETRRLKLSTLGLSDALDRVVKSCAAMPPNTIPLGPPAFTSAPKKPPLAPPALVPAAPQSALN